MPQGPPGIPKRIHARPRGSPKEPLGHPRDTQGHPKPAQELPTDRQGPPKQLAFMYQLRAGAWCARFTGGGAFLTDVLSCTGSVRAAAEP